MASRWLAVDKTLLVTTIGLVGLGLLMVYSASFPAAQQRWGNDTHYLTRHAVAVGAAMLALMLTQAVDYRFYRRRIVVALAVLVTLGALVGVLVVAPIAGVNRWLDLGPVNLQPSEVAKLTVILFLASYLARRDEEIDDLRGTLMPALVVVGLITLLVALQPDLGTATAIAATVGVLLFVAGMAWRHIFLFGGVALLAVAAQILRTGYQARRIAAFLNPWADPADAGFQTVQSLIAVGSGGWTGVGLAEGKQKLFYLPQPHTDFIFAVIAEELGFVGAGLALLGFLVILWRGMRAALNAPDRFGFYLGIGLTAFIVLQALVNMSVVVNLVPVTGIPLPLVSFGGSSLVTCCAAIGVLLNLSQHG